MEGLTRRQLLKRVLAATAVIVGTPAEISILNSQDAETKQAPEAPSSKPETTEDKIFKNFSPEEKVAFEKDVVDQIDAYKKSGSLRAERVLDWEETTLKIILNKDVPEKDHRFWKDFTSAIVYVESEGKHLAQSETGALGLTQLTPATAERVANKHGIYNFDLRNGWTALRLGRFYLADLMANFGVDISVLAYYAGEGFAKKMLLKAEQSGIDQNKINISNLGSLDGKEYLTKVVAALRILDEERKTTLQTKA